MSPVREWMVVCRCACGQEGVRVTCVRVTCARQTGHSEMGSNAISSKQGRLPRGRDVIMDQCHYNGRCRPRRSTLYSSLAPLPPRAGKDHSPPLADKETDSERGISGQRLRGLWTPNLSDSNSSPLPPGWQMLMRSWRAGRDTRSVKTGWSSAHRPWGEGILGRELFYVLPIL